MPPLETFPALNLSGLAHGFTLRIPGLDVSTNDKSAALKLFRPYHLAAVESLGFPPHALKTAEQIHGAEIAVVDADSPPDPVPDADGLVTGESGVLLGIYVADCCPVYLADRKGRAVALLHSGKKGTELEIVPRGIAMLRDQYGVPPTDIIAQLGPCIRPPAYEVDFAKEIRDQCARSEIPTDQIHDPGTCTSSDLTRYYSYRIEQGKTGRMLALLGRIL